MSRSFLFAVMMMLLLPLLAACGGSDADEESAGTQDDNAVIDAGSAADVELAPEIGTIDNWYNGDATTLAALRGEPVLLVFWADY